LGLDAQFVHDALAVVAQTKTGFDNAAAGQQLRRNRAAFRVMQLKHPSPLGGGQLQDVRPV